MSDQTKFIQVLAMVGAVGQGFAHDFGFPMPRVRKGNKYTPPNYGKNFLQKSDYRNSRP